MAEFDMTVDTGAVAAELDRLTAGFDWRHEWTDDMVGAASFVLARQQAERPTPPPRSCPTCGHAVRVADGTTRHFEPTGCFQLVDDHELCDREATILRGALDRIAGLDRPPHRHAEGFARFCPRCIAREAFTRRDRLYGGE